MQDERINLLAKNLINYSCGLKKGEKVLIEAKGIDYMLVNALVQEAYKVGAYPFVELYDNRITRELLLGQNEEQAKLRAKYDGFRMSEMDAYTAIIKENIAFDDLVVAYPYERETIEGIKQLILETVLNKNDSMVIASNTYPVALVKSKFLKLNYSHIEYVMDCFKSNTSKVKNIKKYLLAALFNAPSTMDSYYRAEVNHDMPYMTMARLEAL